MTDINNLFFEGQCKREQRQARLSSAECSLTSIFYQLIQVAIDTRSCLAHTPSADEWGELYAMAKMQSLVGVCFAGVQRLVEQQQTPEEMLYLTWMGLAAKIQQRNEVVNRQCAELGKRLEVKGYRYAILKGQGVASLYRGSGSTSTGSARAQEFLKVSSDLSLLRQSGDIDVWVQNKSIPELVEYVKVLGVGYKATAAHVECQLFTDTDVELHAEPAFMRNFRTNRKLVQWFNSSKGSIVESELGFSVPSIEFNLVYMMVHMYHHVLFEGLGLRQLMDYYFVLLAANKTKTIKTPEGSASACVSENLSELNSSATQSSASSYSAESKPSGKKLLRLRSGQASKQPSIPSVLDNFGMKRFATGIMWILKEVFALEDRCLICEASEKYGRLILEDVMSGGNFGYHDEKNKGLHGGTAVGRSLNGLKRNMKFFALGPWEILSSPVWSLWHYVWRKCHGFM